MLEVGVPKVLGTLDRLPLKRLACLTPVNTPPQVTANFVVFGPAFLSLSLGVIGTDTDRSAAYHFLLERERKNFIRNCTAGIPEGL